MYVVAAASNSCSYRGAWYTAPSAPLQSLSCCRSAFRFHLVEEPVPVKHRLLPASETETKPSGARNTRHRYHHGL